MKIKASELEYKVFDHENSEERQRAMQPGNMLRLRYEGCEDAYYLIGEVNEVGGTGSEWSVWPQVEEAAFATVMEIEDE